MGGGLLDHPISLYLSISIAYLKNNRQMDSTVSLFIPRRYLAWKLGLYRVLLLPDNLLLAFKNFIESSLKVPRGEFSYLWIGI